MREGTAPIVYRADYQAPAFWIRAVELTFDLDPAKTIVASKLSIERNAQAAPGQPLVLHGEELNLLRVMCNGEGLSFRHENDTLTIDNPPAQDSFVLEIRNTCAPEKNKQLSGLYTSGSGFFTQCEAEGFRRITFFLDRPDVMAVYTVTLRADKARYPVLLSNGNLLEQGSLDNGRHYAKWHDPFPKPSYLFALVAADLVCREQRVRTRAGKDHLLQIYVKRGDLEKTEHAMHSLVASLVWDEARFGLPLDLERFMIVAVADFNMGAMENKGLNIFNTAYVLASAATATDTDFANVESVVAHEYFHNWTGNRITCRDWFQLSLKEGLMVFRDQEFSQDMAGSASARAVKRIEDVRNLRMVQFPEDAGPMAHPVRPDSYAAIDNFYTPTVYEKGSEVVRMMQTLVGRDGFARGMALYFQRHDGQAVTCDDFAQAMADANPGSALAGQLTPFKRWYAQAGTPRVQARGQWDAETRRWTLTLTQTPAAADGQPQVIPVTLGLLDSQDQPLPLRLAGEAEATGTERTLVLTEATQQFVLEDVPEAPLPSLLRGFSAPVLLDDGLDDHQLLRLLRADTDAFNRWEAAQRLLQARFAAAMASPADAAQGTWLDDALVEALRSVLRHPQLDAAFKELVLNLPSEHELFDRATPADAQRVNAVRESMLNQLAQVLHGDWVWAWEAHQLRSGYQADAHQSGCRALANLALGMLVRQAVATGDTVWPGKAYQRTKDAGNMTDRLGALAALVNVHAELAQPALDRFLAQYSGEALVVDKWFALQARAPERDGRVFARVKQLLKHPQFSVGNPNRARALLQVWMRNPAAFHRTDAAGYVLWAEKVAEIDAFNPQLAARLARSMDHWRRLAEPCRTAAQEAITRVAARPDLSADVKEIVSRALHD
ncbi:MAG: aminopeptidase N [Rubrivivax sp.]